MIARRLTYPISRGLSQGFIKESSADFVEFTLAGTLADTTGGYIFTTVRASTKNDFDVSGELKSYAVDQPAYGPTGHVGIHDGFTNSISAARYRDFTGWTAANGTVDSDSITAIDGTTRTTNTFTATSANATLFQGAITAASAQHAGGVMIKAKVGTSVEVSNDGGATWSAFTINGSTWVKCWHSPTVANPDFGIRLANSGDAVYIDWALSCLNKKYPFVMVEGGSSTLPDDITLLDFIVSLDGGAFTATINTEAYGDSKRILLADGLASIGMHTHSSGTVLYGIFGNGNNSTWMTPDVNTPIKVGVSRIEGQTYISRNGLTIAPTEADATGTFTGWNLGSLGYNPTQNFNGYIGNVKFHKTGLTSEELTAETTP